jgi:hypothetical protein
MFATTSRSAAPGRPPRSSITRATAGASIRKAHLAGYAGILQADAYDGYNKLYLADRKPGPIREAACWVHARRPFFVMADIEENARRKAAGKKEIPLSPIAIEVARRIDALFAIEQSINGKSPEERLAVRRVTSRTLVDALMTYMREQAAKLSRGHDLAKAIQSMLKRWPRRRHVQPHRHGKDERRRSAGVARRRAQAHRRARLIGSTSCCRGTGERRL